MSDEARTRLFQLTCRVLQIGHINNNIWHLHSLSIDESQCCVGNSSVVKIYIIRPKPGPVAKNATSRTSGWESNKQETGVNALIFISF